MKPDVTQLGVLIVDTAKLCVIKLWKCWELSAEDRRYPCLICFVIKLINDTMLKYKKINTADQHSGLTLAQRYKGTVIDRMR